MHVTVVLLVGIAAFLCVIANALNKCPAWVPMLLLSIGLILLAGVPAR